MKKVYPEQSRRVAVVTGGAGFIGSHLVHALLQQGYTVRVIDTLVAGKRARVPNIVRFSKADIRDPKKLLSIFKGATVVFHLAALPSVPYSIEHPDETHEINVTGTLRVLQAAKEQGVKRVVFASSSAIYGSHTTMPLTEDLAARPLSPYALHKYMSEKYLQLFSELYQIETVALRFFNVYGPGIDPTGPYAAVIGKFIMLKKEKRPLTIVGDGEQTRDFVHVSDIARALILAAESTQVGKGEVINVGIGKAVSVNALADLFGGERVYLPPRIEPRASLASIVRAKKLIGWSPKITLKKGILETKRTFNIS